MAVCKIHLYKFENDGMTNAPVGHNDIMGHSPVALAIMRAFDLHGTTYNNDDNTDSK